MPMYEFECKNCGRKKEQIVAISSINERVNCACGHFMTRGVGKANFTLRAKDGFYGSKPKK